MSNSLPATAFSVIPTPVPASLNPAPVAETSPRSQLTVVPPVSTQGTAPAVAREQAPEVPQSRPPAPGGQPAPIAPAAADEPPALPDLLRIYREQKRECWMCKKIAGSIDAGKEPSEDDRWHFTTCVLSWAGL